MAENRAYMDVLAAFPERYPLYRWEPGTCVDGSPGPVSMGARDLCRWEPGTCVDGSPGPVPMGAQDLFP